MRGVAAVVLAFTAGCEGTPGMPGGTSEPVTLVVTIDKDHFAPDALLDARIWSAAQLPLLEANARCTAVRDPLTGATRHQCPPGQEYHEVEPETFQLSTAALGDQVELTSTAVRTGEKLRLRISGLYRDKCNTTSADVVLEARAARTVVGNLAWQTTAKACLQEGKV